MRSCASCFFYRRDGFTDQGDCMVNPPVPLLVAYVNDEATFVSVVPVVGSQDYCSQFSHRAGPKAAPA